jgi:hypothetical protein
MSEEERRRRLWEEDYGSEEEFLHAWGFPGTPNPRRTFGGTGAALPERPGR